MQVVDINDYQKNRFVKRMITSMFNTIRTKQIAVLGFAFKADTGDTRETPAIDVCRALIDEDAVLRIYDPKVEADQIYRDLSLNKFEWDHPRLTSLRRVNSVVKTAVTRCESAMDAVANSHAVAILTEWSEFKTLDWCAIYESMTKPAFLFDGRNILDHDKLREIGFVVYALGKPLDPFLCQTMP